MKCNASELVCHEVFSVSSAIKVLRGQGEKINNQANQDGQVSCPCGSLSKSVGCDISHHFPYAYSFSDGMGTAEYLAAVECHDGKEICPAATKPSSVVRHDLALLVIGANHRTLRAG